MGQTHERSYDRYTLVFKLRTVKSVVIPELGDK